MTPRWGETAVRRVPTFTLRDDQFASLCRLFGLRPADTFPEFKATLEGIGARYLLWIEQDERGPSQAERNAALKHLS